MSKKDKSKAIQKTEEKESNDERRERSCCYVVDPCGCYVDPCCCSPSVTCCC
jgi:hypothetical protein